MGILRVMESGGGFMWWILLALLFGVAIALERLFMVMIRYNVNGNDLMIKVRKSILGNKLNRAVAICDGKPHAALSMVFKAGLLAIEKPVADIEKAVEDASLEAIQKIQTRTSYLGTIANVATLLGLLGTIFGLIDSFESVGAASAARSWT